MFETLWKPVQSDLHPSITRRRISIDICERMKLFVVALMLLVTVVEADISGSAGKFWDGDCQSDDQCVSVSHCLDKGNLSVESLNAIFI